MPIVPCFWIARNGRILDCDQIDTSHAAVVVNHADAFGLSWMAPHLQQMHASDDFDFDHAIALTEAAGWTRTSRDADGTSGIAISSADPRLAAAATRLLETRYGIFAEDIDLELSQLSESVLTQRYYRIEGRDLAPFRRYGRIPAARSIARMQVGLLIAA